MNSLQEIVAVLCIAHRRHLCLLSFLLSSCKTSSSHYGAICFSNSNGQCVFYCVCGYDCCSTFTGSSYCQFAYAVVNNSASSKNYVNYSSISRCVNERSDSYFILHLVNGKIYCPSVNMSMNKCQQYSAILCSPSYNSSSVTNSLSYSSFVDNNALGYTCFYFSSGGVKHEIKCCNILRNTQGTNTWGTIYSLGNLFIDDSCILENTATYIFYLSSSSYSTTLSNCTVDKTTSNQNLITRNTVTKSFILGLNHMSTQNCNSEYDAAGYLTPIPYVSSLTKKEFCYTCKRNDILSRISDFFSLNWLFIVPFIHPNPSVDC
jgi:hypothetical protein